MGLQLGATAINPALGAAVAAARPGQGGILNRAANAGMSYGMGQLGDWMNGPEATADTSQFADKLSVTGNNPAFAQGAARGLSVSPELMNANDPLTQWAMSDAMKRFGQGYSFGGFGF